MDSACCRQIHLPKHMALHNITLLPGHPPREQRRWPCQRASSCSHCLGRVRLPLTQAAHAEWVVYVVDAQREQHHASKAQQRGRSTGEVACTCFPDHAHYHSALHHPRTQQLPPVRLSPLFSLTPRSRAYFMAPSGDTHTKTTAQRTGKRAPEGQRRHQPQQTRRQGGTAKDGGVRISICRGRLLCRQLDTTAEAQAPPPTPVLSLQPIARSHLVTATAHVRSVLPRRIRASWTTNLLPQSIPASIDPVDERYLCESSAGIAPSKRCICA